MTQSVKEAEKALLERVHEICYEGESEVSIDLAMAEMDRFGLRPLTELLRPGGRRLEKKVPVSRAVYMSLYTLGSRARNESPEESGQELRDWHKAAINKWITNTLVSGLGEKQGEMLLTEFCARWENHRLFTEWMRRLFKYLDADTSDFGGGHQGVQQTLTSVGLKAFKTLLFDAHKHHITATIQTLVNRDREHEMVDKSILKSAVTMFLIMGIAELKLDFKDNNAVGQAARSASAGMNDTYVRDFEDPFLANTREFYAAKANDWLTTDTAPVYLAKTERALAAEDERVHTYLNPATKPKLLSICRDVLLADHMEELLRKEGSGMLALLADVGSAAIRAFSAGGGRDGGGGGGGGGGGAGPGAGTGTGGVGAAAGADSKRGDLGRMYRLFSHVNGGVASMAALFREHVTTFGRGIVDKRVAKCAALAAGGGAGAGGDARKKPKPPSVYDPDYVEELLAAQRSLFSLLKHQFDEDQDMHKALKIGLETVVNKPAGPHSHPELAAVYIDHALRGRRGSDKLTDHEVAVAVADALDLFRYFTDKDVFRAHYRDLLAKRILTQKSFSDDAEKAAISAMKAITSPNFAFRLEGMINDLAVTKEQSQEYTALTKADRSSTAGVEFGAFALKTGYWPSFFRVPDLMLPPEMDACCRHFSSYYVKLPGNSAKQLNWVHSQGSATVRVVFNKGGWKDLIVTTLQAVVLLLFKQRPSYTLVDLAAAMGVDKGNARRIVAPMSLARNYRVLKKTPAGSSIKDTDVFTLDYDFNHRSKTVTLPVPALQDRKAMALPDDERRHVIDSVLVRTMKFRKRLPHAQLVSDVVNQIKFFRPTPKSIKVRISALMGEYIRRDGDDVNSPYVYIAGDDGY